MKHQLWSILLYAIRILTYYGRVLVQNTVCLAQNSSHIKLEITYWLFACT